MCLKWKCSIDDYPKSNRVIIYDHINKTFSGAYYITFDNEWQTPYFVLDCGGTKKIHELVFFAECPKMDQQILKAYKNHF